MNNRVYTIDVLRCLAIVGMVFSGQILWHAELPAWLFHAQVPPPDFKFDPSIPGITWVDLVFPFFLFSMGAAFPLALRSKIEKGVSSLKIGWDVVKRALLLALFAIALANTRGGNLSMVENDILRNIMILGTWGIFFCMFVRLKSLTAKANNMLNIGGIVAIVGLLLFYKFGLDVNITVKRSDIIILVLANMALFGTGAWWFTRDNIPARIAIVALVIFLKIASTVDGSWTQTVWTYAPVSWLCKIDFLKYLCIVLPGTIAGDYIYKWIKSSKDENPKGSKNYRLTATILLFALIGVNMWGLFTRHLVANFIITGILGIAIYYLLKFSGKGATDTLHNKIYLLGILWLILGLVIEPFEGGIRKDHATISYFLVTSGLASMMVVGVSMLLNYFKANMNFLVKIGQNPMIAYTASGFIVMPILSIVNLDRALGLMCEQGAWYGVLRGAIVTALMMLITWLFTRAKIFWRT